MKTTKLRLPATSANLGPGFDAMALALDLFLEIEATPASQYSINATGRNRDICGSLTRNLLIETYEGVLAASDRKVQPLQVAMHNGIPIGMGCGSSAAVRLAGVALASAFGGLDWDAARIVEEAARLEGHPDNVAACWHGGLTIAADAEKELGIVTIAPPPQWSALVVLPQTPVATARARSVLPQSYCRQDVVASLQCVALLTAAFALGRGDLLRLATRDRLHQPYRAELCPLLPVLLPLAGSQGVLSVTLSGAGPAVLLLTLHPEDPQRLHLEETILELTRCLCPVEIVPSRLCTEGVGITRW
jgi:homoserine kinase